MTSYISRISRWYFSRRALPYWGILALDCVIVFLSGLIVHILNIGLYSTLGQFWPLMGTYALYGIFYLLGFWIFRTYSGIIRYSSFVDLQRLAFAMLLGTGCIIIARLAIPTNEWLVYIRIRDLFFTFILATTLMWSVRVVVKYIYDLTYHTRFAKRVFIYGVRQGGIALAKSLRNEDMSPYRLAGFVSHEPEMQHHLLMGVKVFPDDDSLVERMHEKDASVLLVSPHQSTVFRNKDRLINQLSEAGIHIFMMPTAVEWDGRSDVGISQLKEVEIEDLLPRDEIHVDMDAVGKLLEGKKILITGAAGSIGSEMVRQIAIYHPSEMILIDQAETPMHDVRLLMQQKFPDVPSKTIVASISNETYMEQIFRDNRPDYVFHAAAYKHVPMMEDNPSMAVQNNIYGTRVVADLAVKYGTKKFVMISTDKAVNPTNVMGCSKRICEIYCQSLNKAILDGTSGLQTVDGETPVTQFITTRFGNVLGSNGSVIPLFRKQIQAGGPVTVTHPDIIRYFMLIPEACKLVLEAGTMGKGGEIFVFDMGKPVKIAELARRMILLSGAKNVEIRYTGLRDGEKLYEEMLNDAEVTKPTFHPKIKIAAVREYAYADALEQERKLYELSFTYDDMAIVRAMKQIVPEYKSQHSKYEVLD
ncbi:MAG: nucleoside-diphosphate sugar epimerase/dehydratase [bacterium]|nr:nucleoside-diphosphate sugar epimerase/dehydratase [bacterium]